MVKCKNRARQVLFWPGMSARLLVKAKDHYKALLDYANSPLDTGFSPAQLFLSRRLKNNVTDNIQTPTTRTWRFQGASHRNGLSSAGAEILHRQEGKRKPVDISSWRSVMMKFGYTWKRAEVVTPHSTPRSYVVRDERKQYRRN